MGVVLGSVGLILMVVSMICRQFGQAPAHKGKLIVLGVIGGALCSVAIFVIGLTALLEFVE